MVSFNTADSTLVTMGRISVTWRLWKYAHVKAGKVYGLGSGGLVIEDVRTVRVGDVTDADALEAGLRSADDLVELARSHTGADVSPDTLLYRVQFHYTDEAPEKPRLELPEIRRRLERLDGATAHGAWTEAALRLIEENPGTVARELAAEMGMPALYFKTNVRKLKALGLTISLEVGYELSELGQAYLDSLDEG
jgi:hypothetical protein